MFFDEAIVYKDYLPERLQGYVEIDALNNSINLEFGKLMEFVKKGINNKSIANADVDGVARWEKLLGVTSPLNSTLQARRDALKARLMTKPPINKVVLKGIVEAYMGVEVDIEVVDFVVKVTYRGESRVADLKPLYVTAYETIPANLLMDISYAYLTWSEVSAITWGQAAGKTWDQFRKGL